MSVATIRRSSIEVAVKRPVTKGAITSITRLAQLKKAKVQAKKIIAAIHEAEEIHSGRKQAESFDDFLNELQDQHARKFPKRSHSIS